MTTHEHAYAGGSAAQCDHCGGGGRRWYIPLTDETLCHSCYEWLLGRLSPEEQTFLRSTSPDSAKIASALWQKPQLNSPWRRSSPRDPRS